MTSTQPTLFTVGYSTHEWSAFVALVRFAGVTAVADVRSTPYGRLVEYRREELAAGLRGEGIAYVWLGAELGARRDESQAYRDGRVDYERVMTLPAFRAGVERLARGAEQHTIALMCAEREPLDCHRSLLIARALVAEGWRVRHVLPGAAGETPRIEEHAETERRLVELVGVDPLLDRATPYDELLRRAYAERGRLVSYEIT
ncbi:MAG: DUF488 family protein [Lacipirellulaceae bacterium]